jgi:hypothetical protein
VTFESYANKHIGTSCAPDGNTPALKLIWESEKAKLTSDEKQLLDYISPAQSLTIKNGKVLHWGGSKYKIYELEKGAPQIWKVQFGNCSIEYPKDSKNYLCRLGVGDLITG